MIITYQQYIFLVMRQWAAYSVASIFTARCANNWDPEVRPWPNITLADFSDEVRGLIVLAHSQNIEFSPLFENNETIRKEWEAYAAENEVSMMSYLSMVHCLFLLLFVMNTNRFHLCIYFVRIQSCMFLNGQWHTEKVMEITKFLLMLGNMGVTTTIMRARANHMLRGCLYTTMGEFITVTTDIIFSLEQQPILLEPSHHRQDMSVHGDFGPGMNKAEQVALSDHNIMPDSTENRLRGRRRTGANVPIDEHEIGHKNEHPSSHTSMSHTESLTSSGESNMHGSNNNCAAIGALTGEGHAHSRRPVEEGIYTMDGPR